MKLTKYFRTVFSCRYHYMHFKHTLPCRSIVCTVQDCLVAHPDDAPVQPLAVALIVGRPGDGSTYSSSNSTTPWAGKVEGLAVQAVEEVKEASVGAGGESGPAAVRLTLLAVTDPDGGVSESGIVHLTIQALPVLVA
jgi:hypothetical protein